MSIFTARSPTTRYRSLACLGGLTTAAGINFRKNLTRRMEDRNVSDSELARALKVAPITVGRWKRGLSEPNFAHLDQMATFLDTTVAALIAGPEDLVGAQTDQARQLTEELEALRSIREVLSRKR